MNSRARSAKAASRLIFARQARQLAEERRQIPLPVRLRAGPRTSTPLSAIEGYLNIIRDHSAGDDPKVYDAILARSLDRIEGMRKMVFDLLDLTRIESGRKRRELAALDAVDSARRAIDAVASEARRRKIAVTLDAPETLPFTADRGELDIIMSNLLTNAIKYNVEGGRVDVGLALEAGAVRITVRDTGIGMSAEGRRASVQRFRENQEFENPRDSGQRPRPLHREEARRALRRRSHRPERAGRGERLYRHPPASGRARRNGGCRRPARFDHRSGWTLIYRYAFHSVWSAEVWIQTDVSGSAGVASVLPAASVAML